MLRSNLRKLSPGKVGRRTLATAVNDAAMPQFWKDEPVQPVSAWECILSFEHFTNVAIAVNENKKLSRTGIESVLKQDWRLSRSEVSHRRVNNLDQPLTKRRNINRVHGLVADYGASRGN